MTSSRVVPLFKAVHSSGMEAAALDTMRSGMIANGPKVEAFEGAFGAAFGFRDVVCTSDMTAALSIALRLAGVGAGDEVATISYACMSSNAAIALCGARPAWVDMDPATATMSTDDLAAVLSPRVKAVLLYHAAGYPGAAREVAALCRERGIALIEDCNNALGASRDGVAVGAIGDFAVFSFYPNRQINALEGGALVCRDPDAAARARRLRRFGIDMRTFRDRFGEIDPASDISEVGWSAGFSQLHAAVGLCQLEDVHHRISAHRRNTARLAEQVCDVPGIQLVQSLPGASPVPWACLLLAERRDCLLQRLKSSGIGASKLHQRNDGYSGFGVRPREMPGTDSFMGRVIALPCGWWLAQDDVDYVASALRTYAA